MPIVRSTDARRSETPNAVMWTLASPTLGESHLSLWRVTMPAGASGPAHYFDVEQVLTVVRGGAEIALDGQTHAVDPGDTVVLPAGAVRQVMASRDGFEGLAVAPAGARALLSDGTDRGTPPWIR